MHVELPIVGWGETRPVSHRTVDIDQPVAVAADEVMVIVANSILEACRRTGRLNRSDDVVLGQHGQRVVDRLARYRSDLSPNGFGNLVGAPVWLSRYGSQHGQALRRHLKSVFSQENMGGGDAGLDVVGLGPR